MIKSDENLTVVWGSRRSTESHGTKRTKTSEKRKLFISSWARKPSYIIITHQSPDVTLLCNLIAFLFKPAIFYCKEEESPYYVINHIYPTCYISIDASFLSDPYVNMLDTLFSLIKHP